MLPLRPALARTALLGVLCALPACGSRASAPAPADAAPPANPSPASTPLPEHERNALSGEILAAARHGQHLALFAFDPRGGPPALIHADPERDLYPSPSGRLALAVLDAGERHREQLVLVDGSPRAIGPESGRVREPTLAPDGSYVVFDADTQSYRDLYRLQLRGPTQGTLTRLTDDKEGNFEPSLAPDGSAVVFTSSRDQNSEIYTQPLLGPGARSSRVKGALVLTDPKRLTNTARDDWGPKWSPDGRWIAFVSDRDAQDRIYVMRPDGTGVRLVGTPLADGGAEEEIAWSPDGRALAFTRSEVDGHSAIYLVRLDAGATPAAPTRLSPPAARDREPSWSPDGRYLVFTGAAATPHGRGNASPNSSTPPAGSPPGAAALYLMRADGSGRTPVAGELEAPLLPRWRAPSTK